MEIRWLTSACNRTPILQLRTILNSDEVGPQDPVWSKWEDVPTFFDENRPNPLLKT